MTLELNHSPETDKNVTIKAYSNIVYISSGDKVITISMEDFLCGVAYALTNADLIGMGDVRRSFVRYAKSLKTVPGFNKGRRRFQSKAPILLSPKKGEKKRVKFAWL